MAMTTWRKLIERRMDPSPWFDVPTGDTWADVEACTLTDAELDQEFYDGFGSSEGKPFTLWTKNWVYFPVVYDGAESVGAAPRHPGGPATRHVGGQ